MAECVSTVKTDTTSLGALNAGNKKLTTSYLRHLGDYVELNLQAEGRGRVGT